MKQTRLSKQISGTNAHTRTHTHIQNCSLLCRVKVWTINKLRVKQTHTHTRTRTHTHTHTHMYIWMYGQTLDEAEAEEGRQDAALPSTSASNNANLKRQHPFPNVIVESK